MTQLCGPNSTSRSSAAHLLPNRWPFVPVACQPAARTPAQALPAKDQKIKDHGLLTSLALSDAINRHLPFYIIAFFNYDQYTGKRPGIMFWKSCFWSKLGLDGTSLRHHRQIHHTFGSNLLMQMCFRSESAGSLEYRTSMFRKTCFIN